MLLIAAIILIAVIIYLVSAMGKDKASQTVPTHDQNSATITNSSAATTTPAPTVAPTTDIADSKPIKVYLNGIQVIFNEKPVGNDINALVPMNELIKAFNANVEYDEKAGTLKADRDGQEVSFKMDEKVIYIDSVKKEIDTAPEVVQGTVLVPLQAVAEGFGAQVVWDDKSNSAILTTGDTKEANNWVGTWAASPYLVTPDNMPPDPGLANNTLRQVIRVSISRDQLRLKFSNEYGEAPLTMNSVHLAVSDGGSAIKADTDKAITFGGEEAVTIPAGETVTSDTIAYHIDGLASMTITISFGDMPSRLTGHPGSRTTSFIDVGNTVTAQTMPSAVTTERWYVISGIDVLTDDTYRSVVILGDSITDGRGTTTDKNNRWTDILANRLQEFPATTHIGVLNQGIGGNSLMFGGLGPTAVSRFDRDVLGQSGVRYLIIMEGVNDIGGASSSEKTVTDLINQLKELIKKAHEHNILVYGATLTPFGGSSYDINQNEQLRKKYNDWIRTSGEFDGVIDFDTAVAWKDNTKILLPMYDSGDHLHLKPFGYKVMGDIIDLDLFTR